MEKLTKKRKAKKVSLEALSENIKQWIGGDVAWQTIPQITTDHR